jgi:hypothetical protein
MHGPGTAAVVLPQQVQHTTKLSALSAQGTVWLQCSMVAGWIVLRGTFLGLPTPKVSTKKYLAQLKMLNLNILK